MKKHISMLRRKAALAGMVAAGMLTSAQALALDAAVKTAIESQAAQIQTDGSEMASIVWPIVISLTGMAIAFKVFKRFINKV